MPLRKPTYFPMLKGCPMPLKDTEDMPDSDGVQFIIEEAMKDDERPLYILLQGCLTDLAAALNQCHDAGVKSLVIEP